MKPPKPLKSTTFDKAVTTLFGKADTDRDGVVTLEEIRAAIDARLDELIQARFRRIDSNDDGSLDAAEFFGWQRQMGTLALSEQQTPQRDTELVPAVIEPDLGNDNDDRVLRRLIAPVSATMLVEANTNYDGGMTLAEFLAYQRARFAAADRNGDGEISMVELRLPGPGGGPGPANGPSGRPD